MVLPLIISACNSQPSETKALPLTEDQLKQRLTEIEEKGLLNIETIEEAAQIASYKIAVPAFIPEGFQRNKYIMLNKRGAGLPEDMAVDFPIEVQQMWLWQEDTEVWFILLQSPKEFGVGSSGDKFSIGWQDGDMYYALSGTVTGPLTEDILNRIVSSVDTD